jgi:hypothetical protein
MAACFESLLRARPRRSLYIVSVPITRRASNFPGTSKIQLNSRVPLGAVRHTRVGTPCENAAILFLDPYHEG